MPAASPVLPRSRAAARAFWLALAAAALGLALWVHGPIAQWADYHAFADQRAWLGMPNAANVLSNLPFLFIGAWGLWRLRSGASSSPSVHAWRAFSVAIVCTAIGSASYHWAPSNATLAGDRLPIAWACAAFLSAFLGERVHPRWCGAIVLGSALVCATLAVWYWWATEQSGQGDLRPYLYFQLLPMLVVPMALGLRLPPTFAAATPAGAWWAVLALYAAAKVMEVADHTVFEAAGFISGHTLKHLFAAAGAAWLLGAATQAQADAQAGEISSDSRR